MYLEINILYNKLINYYNFLNNVFTDIINININY